MNLSFCQTLHLFVYSSPALTCPGAPSGGRRSPRGTVLEKEESVRVLKVEGLKSKAKKGNLPLRLVLKQAS
jgi:hypothetical protein